MKKLKLSVLAVLTIFVVSSVFYSCATDESEQETLQKTNLVELQKNLYDLESNINFRKNTLDNNTFDTNQVKTSFNDYDNLGIEFLLFLETIKQIENQKDIEIYVNENISRFNSFKFELNDSPKKIIKSFLGNKINDNSIIYTIKEYENFVKDNFNKDSDDYDQLLAFFSLNKWISYKYIYLDESNENNINARDWICGHRDCFDCCMTRSIGNYNVVDWAEVIVSGGAALAWQAGSCIWDCN